MSINALSLAQYLMLEGQGADGQALEVIPVPEVPNTPGLTEAQWLDIKVYAVAKLMAVNGSVSHSDSIGVSASTLFDELEVLLHQRAQATHGGDSKRWAEAIRALDSPGRLDGDAAIAAVYTEAQRLLSKLTISRFPAHQGAELDLDEIRARPATWVQSPGKAHKAPSPWDFKPLDGVALPDLVTRAEWLTLAADLPTLLCGVPNPNHNLGPAGWELDRPPRAGTASGRQAHYTAQREAKALNLPMNVRKALSPTKCRECSQYKPTPVRRKSQEAVNV